MSGGALTAAVGPLFYVTNTNAVVTLTGVNATAVSGTLIKVSDGRWGKEGANGGNLTFTAEKQTLTGDIEVNNISAIALTLRNGSSLTGAINAANTAGSASLTLDSSSVWNVTADSYLACLNNSGGTIHSNGHVVSHDSAACH